MIEIEVLKYYGNTALYSVMPPSIFDNLETAALNNQKTCFVDKALFDKMMSDYYLKMN
ncbi:MAG: hypothetical protein MJZ90_02505 [Bacteroidales bacterium]|nr:hypothetical protein [Bacteroidales bacterium]